MVTEVYTGTDDAAYPWQHNYTNPRLLHVHVCFLSCVCASVLIICTRFLVFTVQKKHKRPIDLHIGRIERRLVDYTRIYYTHELHTNIKAALATRISLVLCMHQ